MRYIGMSQRFQIIFYKGLLLTYITNSREIMTT